MTTHVSCPGYTKAPYKKLVANYAGEDVYPQKKFRTEWGPIFHRGRLDGTARVLVIGQDPAAHESIARRILVGEAGQRVQGFLAKLGITRSYVMVNAFLYSVYGGSGKATPEITAERNTWFDAIASRNDLQAVVALGGAATLAYQAWPGSANAPWAFAPMTHPTFPESASGPKAEAWQRLTTSWNAALATLTAAGFTPDVVAGPPVPYGARITDPELAPIPEEDLPPGLPAWMRSLDAWARRTGETPAEKRAAITVTIPKNARPPE
jgi:uracil-DNA glycosylase